MRLVLDIWSVLTPRQSRWVLGAQILSIVMAFSTVAGIASIGPFFPVLGNPDLIDQSRFLHWLYPGGFQSRSSFMVTLGLAFVGLVLLANLINVLGSFVMIRLALWIGTDLQSALFAEYLHRPFLFHASTQRAVLFKNVVHETTRVTCSTRPSRKTLDWVYPPGKSTASACPQQHGSRNSMNSSARCPADTTT